MFRRDLIPLLLDRTMSLSEIARTVRETPKDVLDALSHLAKSSKHAEYELIVTPAECRKCGFEFRTDKLSRPGKCPECTGTWIYEPLFEVRRRRVEPPLQK
jgi:predicted Zn-ribbon and HTH transcriptional regulator